MRLLPFGLTLTLAVCLAACSGCATNRLPDLPEISNAVWYLWSGAVTEESAAVVVRLRGPADSVRIAAIPEDGGLPVYSAYGRPRAEAAYAYRGDLRGLQPGTWYAYRAEIDGAVDTLATGRFRTFSREPFSFTMATGSCARTGSASNVFLEIRRRQPDFFFHLGDLHYEDINVNSVPAFLEAFREALTSPTQLALARSTSWAYIWDDHDAGPNDTDGTATSRPAARLAYRLATPHYPLAAGEGDAPIYYAFSVGRVRYVVTDLRSERDPGYVPDGPQKTLMGARQKAWFKRELREAPRRHAVVVWVSTVPWISPDAPGSDNWGGYATERRELADFFATSGVADHLVILSGDAHMVAMDDGTNSGYSDLGDTHIPVIHAAPMDQRGSYKGGPYSEGAFPATRSLIDYVQNDIDGQFVVLDVQDDGGTEVCTTWTGYRVNRRDSDDVRELVSMERCFAARPVGPYQDILDTLEAVTDRARRAVAEPDVPIEIPPIEEEAPR